MAAHDNRGRLSVDPTGNWRLYTNTIPAGAQAVGVVSRGAESGALLRMPTGCYVQANAGALRSLPQAKVLAAIADATPRHAYGHAPDAGV